MSLFDVGCNLAPRERGTVDFGTATLAIGAAWFVSLFIAD
jgi:hypothetical protein